MKKYCLLIILVLILPALILTGCGNDDSADHYVIEDAPGIRITSGALEIILERSESYTLTYTVRTSWAGSIVTPTVHVGKPQNDAKYFKHDLKGTSFYIHNDLLEDQIEIFQASPSLNDNLAAKEYSL